MGFKSSMILFFILLLTACSNNDQSPSQVQEETAQVSKEEFVRLEENEVKAILKENLDSIFHVFVSLGEENNWNNANRADFNLIKPQVVAFATEEFADTALKDLANEFYCECDFPFKPILDYDVRFSFEQSEADVIKVEALEPATEINNMGSMWKFEFVKEADKWKMNQMNGRTLEGEDLKLTKEEAETLLMDEEQIPTFVKEYQSEEASGKAYFFTIKSSHGEGVAAISSKDTHLVYDYGETESKIQHEDKEFTPAEQSKEEVPTPETPVKKESKSQNNKDFYLGKLAEIESKVKVNTNGVTVDMISDSSHNLEMWDAALNEIYGVLKEELSPSEMDQLRAEQRQWIVDRDRAAEDNYDQAGGGTLSRVVYIVTLEEWTKERCYEFVNEYMK